MALEEAVYSRLSTATAVTAKTGTRIRPMKLRQDDSLPGVTYQRISGVRVHAMGSDPGLTQSRFQTFAWASTYKEAKEVSAAVLARLNRFRGTVSSVTIQDILWTGNELDVEEERGVDETVYGVMHDFQIWHED